MNPNNDDGRLDEHDDATQDRITFSQLIEEFTGTKFEEIYKDYLIHGDSNYE
jgi:hypothetical protein